MARRDKVMSGSMADVMVRHGVLDEGANLIQKPLAMMDFAGRRDADLEMRAVCE